MLQVSLRLRRIPPVPFLTHLHVPSTSLLAALMVVCLSLRAQEQDLPQSTVESGTSGTVGLLLSLHVTQTFNESPGMLPNSIGLSVGYFGLPADVHLRMEWTNAELYTDVVEKTSRSVWITPSFLSLEVGRIRTSGKLFYGALIGGTLIRVDKSVEPWGTLDRSGYLFPGLQPSEGWLSSDRTGSPHAGAIVRAMIGYSTGKWGMSALELSMVASPSFTLYMISVRSALVVS